MDMGVPEIPAAGKTGQLARSAGPFQGSCTKNAAIPNQ